MSNINKKLSAYDELEWRGLVDYATAGAKSAIDDKITCYVGIDASGSSLHIGHLLSLLALIRLQRYGNNVIMLLGGGTSLIGDPSGKDLERPLQDEQDIARNVASIEVQLRKLLESTGTTHSAEILNNSAWLKNQGLIQFLRDTAKHITVNSMVKRVSVKTRMERQEGISYTEFSYQLLQAYDFLYLYDNKKCSFQIGGSDQWGNIATGIELIGHKHPLGSVGRHSNPQAIVQPLITTAEGVKIGKSEGNARTISLDPQTTSPYNLHQFMLNVSDDDVIRYLKLFTFLNRDDIEELSASLSAEPHKRHAQHRLADELTSMIHGDSELTKAKRMARLLFEGNLRALSLQDLEHLFENAPKGTAKGDDVLQNNYSLARLAVDQKVFASLGEAKRTIGQGGFYLNEKRVTDPAHVVAKEDVMHDAFLVLRHGKKGYHIVKFE